MSFSISSTDLNDFISPSQLCIKPTESNTNTQPTLIDMPKVSISIDDSGEVFNTYQGTTTKLEPAHITLDDCLACSGCITSAETVLISLQSHKEIYKIIEQNKLDPLTKKTIVVSLSPQSRATFATKYNFSLLETHQKLVYFLRNIIGVDYVFDTSFSRDLTLIESGNEFIRRYNNQQFPMITGVCPGWICYAEKTHPGLVDLIDTTLSPQQMMGLLIKSHFSQKINVSAENVYHVCVMPCYDKKLEASRSDFYDSVSKQVDCVLTSGELELMIIESRIEFSTFGLSPLDTMFTKLKDHDIAGTFGTSSGGHLNTILKHAAHHLFQINLTDHEIENGSERIEIKQGRNHDFVETILFKSENGVSYPLLTFVKAYGFRNIQNLVRKLNLQKKKGKWGGFHFVEVMACPSGCINGGGQLKPDMGGIQWSSGDASLMNNVTKDWILQTEKNYQSSMIQSPLENKQLDIVLNEWIDRNENVFHTRFHPIEKKQFSGIENW